MTGISVNIILDALKSASYSYFNGIKGKRNFVWVSILDGTEEIFDKHTLYICSQEDAVKYACEECCCLCNGEKRLINNNWIIQVEGADSIAKLFNVVQSCFREIQSWCGSLGESIHLRPDYQTLIDLSEFVLNNSIYILDSSLALLACSQNVVDDDEVDLRLRDKGYHAEETLKKFRSFSVFRQYNTSTDLYVCPPGRSNRYSTVSKWLRDETNLALEVVMVCNNEADMPSEGLVDKLLLFIDYCKKCMDRKKDLLRMSVMSHDSLIRDVLFSGFNRPKLIDERARSAGLPVVGEFHILKVLLRNSSYYHVPRLMSEIERILPTAKIVVHEYEGVILFYTTNPEGEEAFRKKLDNLYALLKDRQAMCGVSESFSLLHDMAGAYVQASRALAIGNVLHTGEKNWNSDVGNWDCMGFSRDDTIYFYRDIVHYYVMSTALITDPYIYRGLEYMTTVKNIIDEDRKRGSNDARILFTYLMCERNSGKTGEKLHMHRNNVLYRMSKIREQYNIDLDDYWVRTGLLLCYHYQELENANSLAEMNLDAPVIENV